MPKPKVKFHTELFGFRRSDVARYIEQLGRRCSLLESEFSRLRSDLDEAAESGVRLAYEKSALLAEISAIEDSRDKLAEIQSEYDALARERDALKTQRERTVKKLTELAKFVESIGDA